MTHSRWLPILMLCASNVFMTFAWYGHLKFKGSKLWLAILVSWGIAFFEYCLMVPANRWGSAHYSAIELKIIQEVVTLCVFSAFVILYMGERLNGTTSPPSPASSARCTSRSSARSDGDAVAQHRLFRRPHPRDQRRVIRPGAALEAGSDLAGVYFPAPSGATSL